ncbi:MAG: STAS domain-containing protein [Candidatus Krumholzibacteriia bacterium]
MSRESYGKSEVMKLEGALNAQTVGGLRSELEKIFEDPPQVLVFDLENVQDIDSSGVGALISALKRMRTEGGDVRVLHLQGIVQKLFQLLHLDRAMTICDDLESAVAPLHT